MTRWEQYWEQKKIDNPYPRRKVICDETNECYRCFLREICDTDEMATMANENYDEFERRINEWLDEEVDG